MRPFFLVSQDRVITALSRGAETIFGYGAEEVSGKSLDLVLSRVSTDAQHQDNQPFLLEALGPNDMENDGRAVGRRKDGRADNGR